MKEAKPDGKLERPLRRCGTDGLRVIHAVTRDQVRQAQRLRYQVFCEGLGARLDTTEPGLDVDRFDPYCQHFLVLDDAADAVVACIRILTDIHAADVGGFHAEAEFDLTRVLAVPGRFMEVSRICVRPDYLGEAALGLLWSGAVRFMVKNSFDFLMGCASIPMADGGARASSAFLDLRESYLSPEYLRVFPRVPLPRWESQGGGGGDAVPPLLQAYLTLGARVCGEPCWDPAFNAGDLFMLLEREQLNQCYLRRFPDWALREHGEDSVLPYL